MENKKSFILITGSSLGIGRCLAINLSANYNIILHGRNPDRLEETKSMCSNENSQLLLAFDLVKVDKIEKTISDFIIENNISISHYVHCAGYMKMVPLKMVTLETINTTLATNFISAMISELKLLVFMPLQKEHWMQLCVVLRWNLLRG
jgi:short-subunit dehydrogenase